MQKGQKAKIENGFGNGLGKWKNGDIVTIREVYEDTVTVEEFAGHLSKQEIVLENKLVRCKRCGSKDVRYLLTSEPYINVFCLNCTFFKEQRNNFYDPSMNQKKERPASMKGVDILERVETWSKKGVLIEYIIIDQRENGFGKEVEKGEMPAYTYTVSVLQDGDELYSEALFDHLAEALLAGLSYTDKTFGHGS